MADAHEMVVLVGGDYAGKSSVLRAIRAWPEPKVVSCDAGFVPPPYASLGRLRQIFLGDVLQQADRLYSPDYILSGLQMALIYLRDRALHERASHPVIIDSYYYKVLAKCRLCGLNSDAIFSAWRAFPQPDRVIFLRIDPELAWARAVALGGPNRFEHYGKQPTFEAFVRYQRDLEMAILQELNRLPVDVIDAGGSLDEVSEAVRECVGRPPRPRGRRRLERAQ
jgi:thymidylate kinase